MSINELLTALPLLRILSEEMAIIEGIIPGDSLDSYIYFMAPPSGVHVPYIDPIKAMTVLFQTKGFSREQAMTMAQDEYMALRPTLPVMERPPLFSDFEVLDVPECIPVPRLITLLRNKSLVSENIITFLERVCEITCHRRLFYTWGDPYNDSSDKLSLAEVPDRPRPKDIIEDFTVLPSNLFWEVSAPGEKFYLLPTEILMEKHDDGKMQAWRESIIPVAAHLEKVLGEQVFHFQDIDDELDDDYCHRFLALHCWCSLLPESNFVKYLLEVTGFTDVEELKAALIDPASYTHPFKFNRNNEWNLDLCCFHYLPSEYSHLGFVFQTKEAADRAREKISRFIDCRIYLLFPFGLVDSKWMKEAAPYCERIIDMNHLSAPITILSQLDILYVFSDGKIPEDKSDLNISPEVEDLLWRAHEWNIEFAFYDSGASGPFSLIDPVPYLEKCGVSERIRWIDKKRNDFLHQTGCIRLDADFTSSGLWDKEGKNIIYDYIDIPFPLIKRIAAWQRDFDDYMLPSLPEKIDPEWQRQHDEECLSIASALQKELGDKIDVQVFTDKAVSIRSLEQAE